jgi:Domain of unknown function (DUF4440)
MGYRILSMAMLCLFACFIATDAGQEKPDETAIRVLEAKWVDAYKQRQVTALATLLAEDYVITTEDGTTYSKVGFISYNSGPLHVDEAAMSDLKIRIHENVVVVTGAYRDGRLYTGFGGGLRRSGSIATVATFRRSIHRTRRLTATMVCRKDSIGMGTSSFNRND